MATERGVGREALQDPTKHSSKGTNYLLVIGIDQYQHWPKLNNAVRDAKDVADVLIRQYQFTEDSTHLLLDQEATEGNIYRVIRELKQTIQPDDNLLVYYSGHGHYDEDFDEGFWVPVDAGKDSEGDFISNANIIKRINAIDTHHTLLVIDSCFSGSLVVQKRNTVPDERFKSRRIITSGRYETVSDGRVGENSPFATGMLTFLRKNTAKALDTTTLVRYVKDFVYGKSNQSPVEGRLQNSADEGGEFVFHLRKEEGALWAEASQQNTVIAYQNYLLAFPTGRYVVQANRRLTKLREDEIWQTTRQNDNETAYESYLKKYAPTGKFVQEAEERLKGLRQDREARQEVREQMAERAQEREHMQREYAELVHQAEALFNKRELAAAREEYRSALLRYLPGFVPDQNYLEEQINLCQTNISFLQFYDNGKRAMDAGNYRLAIQYFQEALKNTDNPQVEKLLHQSRQQLAAEKAPPKPAKLEEAAYPKQAQTAANTVPPKKKKRSSRGVLIGVVIGSIACFMVLGVIGSMMDDSGTEDYLAEEEATFNESSTAGVDSYDETSSTTTPVEEDVFIPQQTGRSPSAAEAQQQRVVERNQSSAAAADPSLADPTVFGEWELIEYALNGGSFEELNQFSEAMGSDRMVVTMNFNSDGNLISEYSNTGQTTYNSFRVDNYGRIWIDQFGWGTYELSDGNNTMELNFTMSDGVYTYPLTMIMER